MISKAHEYTNANDKNLTYLLLEFFKVIISNVILNPIYPQSSQLDVNSSNM